MSGGSSRVSSCCLRGLSLWCVYTPDKTWHHRAVPVTDKNGGQMDTQTQGAHTHTQNDAARVNKTGMPIWI